MSQSNYEFDVALSFAGEDRKYVESVANELRSRRVKVFYDKYERVGMWGKDLYSHLDDVYRNKARYCIIFISKYYAKKLLTNHERRSAQARALSESQEYILPARFDATEIPGFPPTIDYIDLNITTPHELAKMLIQKIGHHSLTEYMPKEPKTFYKYYHIVRESKSIIYDEIILLMDDLKKTSADERLILYFVFTEGCSAGLPDNMHINIDILKRLSGFHTSRIDRIIKGMNSLGIEGQITERENSGWSEHFRQTTKIVVVRIYSRENTENITFFLSMLLDFFSYRLCPECAKEAFNRLDFSCLE